MFDYNDALFHVGVLVPDLEAAMTELSEGLGISWAAVIEREQQIWTPEHGASATALRFTYSCEGPQHIELLQGASGTFWDANTRPGLHHHGVWVDDIAAETERRVAQGWTLEIAQKSPEDGYGAMSYLRSPNGFRLEPVTSAVRPRFERWWSGGAFH